ncbi:MAG: ATP phosphoribosyltransferase regulatory subunit, partial [Firmicutes bacterium]|nr:ATP phosphoribosyltransferase regulatory subunit [Bacillota bacterium]
MRSVLTPQEELVFELRELFEENGFRRFRMSKFEDYDLYSRYKDFLVSDAVISFTDTGGALKALKPDVTLSILKSARPAAGETEKLYYNESVYRPADGSFKEMTQCGLECIGALDDQNVLEVVSLAAMSLARISPDYVLSISQPEFIKEAA